LDSHAKRWPAVTKSKWVFGGATRQRILLPRLLPTTISLREAYGILTDARRSAGARHTGSGVASRQLLFSSTNKFRIGAGGICLAVIAVNCRSWPSDRSAELPARFTPSPWNLMLTVLTAASDAEGLHAFVASYAVGEPASSGELWADPDHRLPDLALLENSRAESVARVVDGRRGPRKGRLLGRNRMLELTSKAPAEVVVVLAEMVKEKPAALQPVRRRVCPPLTGPGSGADLPKSQLVGTTNRRARPDAGNRFPARRAKVRRPIRYRIWANAIRKPSVPGRECIGATSWRRMSGVEKILSADPAGVYPSMDFLTRDQYRHAVEEIARQSPLDGR